MARASKRKSKKSKVSQGMIYLYEPDEDTEGEETATISMLIHAAVILELAKLIEAGEVSLTDRDQVRFGGRLYEAEDSNYFESGMVWTPAIERDDWEDILEEFEDMDLEKPSRSSRGKKTSSARKTRGQTRSRR